VSLLLRHSKSVRDLRHPRFLLFPDQVILTGNLLRERQQFEAGRENAKFQIEQERQRDREQQHQRDMEQQRQAAVYRKQLEDKARYDAEQWARVESKRREAERREAAAKADAERREKERQRQAERLVCERREKAERMSDYLPLRKRRLNNAVRRLRESESSRLEFSKRLVGRLKSNAKRLLPSV
jgi:hypothetical protein